MRILTTILLMFAICTGSAFAGDFKVYSKIGIIDWNERYEGKQIVRESGAVQELGIEDTCNIKGLDFDYSAGAWLAQLYYDGSKMETKEPFHTFSTDVGITGYVGSSLPVLKTDTMDLRFMAGLTGNSFIRYIPGELWFTMGAKTGLVARNKNIEFKAGIQYPFFTSNSANLATAEGIVTTRPKGMISPFAEFRFNLTESWKAGAYFEMWRWSVSDGVPYKYIGNNPASMMAKDKQLLQPDTTVISSGVSIEYRF